MKELIVALVGLGSVGSMVFNLLLQAGVGYFILIDPSCLAPANIARHLGDLRYLGWPKVKTLGDMAYRRNPLVEINAIQASFNDLNFEERRELLANANLIISSTDSNDAESEAAFTAFELETPYIHVGLYERAKSGELCFQIPDFTKSCMNCWLGFRKSLQQQEGETLAYSDIPVEMVGRTIAEPGLAADISVIVSIAMQWVMAILMGPDSKRWKNLIDDPDRNLVLINGSSVDESLGLFTEPFEVVRPFLKRDGPCEICRPKWKPSIRQETLW